MARFTTKEALISDILSEREKLDWLLETLAPGQMVEPGVCGEWSTRDILAHLAEWQQMVISWYGAGLRGETVKTPAEDLKWSQLPELNDRIYHRHRGRELPDIREEYRSSHEQMMDLVLSVPEEELFRPGLHPWMGKNTLAAYVGSATGSHYRWARDLIRKWSRESTARA